MEAKNQKTDLKQQIQKIELSEDGVSLISERAKKVSTVVVQVNDLMPVGFPLSGQQILNWSADVDRLRPDVTRQQLEFLFDCFKVGTLVFDKNKGVQNIFEGLKQIVLEDGKWKIKEVWPG